MPTRSGDTRFVFRACSEYVALNDISNVIFELSNMINVFMSSTDATECSGD